MKQDITLDFTTFKNFAQKTAKHFIEDTELTTQYFDFLKELNTFHNICLDKEISSGKSKWFEEFKNFLIAFNDIQQYQYGILFKKSLSDEMFNLFTNNSIIKHSDKNEIDEICEDISNLSFSKIILADRNLNNHYLLSYSFKEFITSDTCYNNLLLRNGKSKNFIKGTHIEDFSFLKPYLMYASTMQINDKFLFGRNTNDAEIVREIVSNVVNLKELILVTKYCDQKDILTKNGLNYLKTSYPNIKITIMDYREHQRRIETDYSEIGIDHSLNNIARQADGYIFNDNMRFTSTLK